MSIRFFFFKQKTAYEMRISDGSSDVCSTDLNVHRNPVCSAFVREIGYQRKKALGMAASDDRMPPGHQFVIFKQCDGAGFGRRVDYQSTQSYSPGESLFSLIDTIEFAKFRARRTRMNLFAIGRASCRERVCQSVKI